MTDQENIEYLEEAMGIVFSHITNGTISKPYTNFRSVLQLADDLEMERIAQARREERESFAEELQEAMERGGTGFAPVFSQGAKLAIQETLRNRTKGGKT